MLAGSVSSMVYAMETDQGIEIKEEVAGEKSAESVLSISENTLDKASKQSVEMLLADSLDIELTLDTEVTTTIKDQNTEVWLKYHVQGDGYYNLSCLFQGARGEVYACMNTKEFYEGYAYAWADQEDYVMLYAHQNDIIYYRMYAEADNITVNATVNYVDSTDLIAAEEGIYSGTAGGYTLTALPRPEYGSAEIDVHVTTENEQLLKGEIYSIFSQNNNYISDITTIGPEKYYTTLNVGTMEPLKINTAYTMQILLQNLEGKTLAVFDGVKFTTKNADQEVIFEIKELTYDSVTILYDNLMGIDHAFYGREGTTEREYLQEGTRTYGPLHAGTKYRIWYEDFDGNILGETSFTTPDMTLRVAEASIEVTGTSTAKIKVNVDAYTGNSENLTLYYVWENAESGPWSQYKTVDVTTDANGVKSAVVEAEITDLLADTAYEIMAWVQEDSDPFSIKHHSFTREITTWKEENAKNVILSAAQSVYDPTSIEYVLNAQVATEEPIDIYYRIKNASNERAWSVYMSTYIGNETTVCRGIIPNCTIGVEYEVKIVFPRLGIYRIASCVMGEDNYHPVMTEDVDVFEANLIYTLPETEATEEDIWTEFH